MRSVPLLVILGASFTRAVSYEQRDSESEDTSENFEDGWSDIVERHDNGFFAAQYPLTQKDNSLLGISSIGPNLGAKDTSFVEQVVYSVETPIARNSLSEKDNQVNTHAILKRVPDFFTFELPGYRSRFQTSLRAVPVSTTITLGTEAPVTITKKIDGPVTVTVSVFVTETATQLSSLAQTAWRFTNAPATVTDEFLTIAFTTVNRDYTLLVLSGSGVYFTVTSPVTVTVTEGVGPTVTVTQTFTSLRSITQYTNIIVTTRTFARILRPPPIATTTSALPSDLAEPLDPL